MNDTSGDPQDGKKPFSLFKPYKKYFCTKQESAMSSGVSMGELLKWHQSDAPSWKMLHLNTSALCQFMKYANVNPSVPENPLAAAQRVRSELARYDGVKSAYEVFCIGEHLLAITNKEFNGDEIQMQGMFIARSLLVAGDKAYPKLMKRKRRRLHAH